MLILIILLCLANLSLATMESFQDMEDPYRNVRFWKIVDFFRNFWLTR